MLSINEVRGAIFDVDETLLDNFSGRQYRNTATYPLHERSRLQAIHEAGKRHDIAALVAVTHEENIRAFQEAPIHSIESAVWEILRTARIVSAPEIDHSHPLLLEIIARKDQLFEILLRTEAKPVAGAVEFVQWVATNNVELAVASTAIRRDIDIFFESNGLDKYFLKERIIAKDNITHPKPHPEVFDTAFATLGLPESARRTVLAFEDHPRGIASAKAAGLFTCGITMVYTREELAALEIAPDLIADSFDEFRRLLS